MIAVAIRSARDINLLNEVLKDGIITPNELVALLDEKANASHSHNLSIQTANITYIDTITQDPATKTITYTTKSVSVVTGVNIS